VITAARWKTLLKWSLLLPLLAGGCTAEFRDAVRAGAFDFVAGTVTELLTLLLPVVEALGAA